MSKAKGIFCLEGDWNNDLRDTSTILFVLELLAKSGDPKVPYIHRDVGTREQFEHYLEKWVQKKYDNYPILYLAMHGEPNQLLLGTSTPLSEEENLLSWMGNQLEGKCDGRIIFFASCETLAPHGNRIRHFLEKTGALAVCGYTEAVDWMRSTAFELLVLHELQQNAFCVNGARAAQNRINDKYKSLVDELGFKMMIRGSKS